MFGPREDPCQKCKSPTLCIRFQGNGFGLLVASVRPCLVEKWNPTYVQARKDVSVDQYEHCDARWILVGH